MRICAIVKYPPIQGGVSAQSFWMARSLAQRGHSIVVVTNAAEVEDSHRIWMAAGDSAWRTSEFPTGGSVTVVETGRLFAHRLSFIPSANPYVTKLAALATEEVRRSDAEVVFSYYFEPYAVAGFLASTWTGVPHVVQHAGSDRVRLMSHPELASSYREVLRASKRIIAAGTELEGLGISDRRICPAVKGFLPDDLFNPSAAPLDVDALVTSAAEDGHPSIDNRSPLDPDLPTVGVYGKVGEVKGSFDLIAALGRLRAKGAAFNFLAMVGGNERPRFVQEVHRAGLSSCTWTLPFLPHWRVPSFIRRCTLVCYLERQFPIVVHKPGIPREILLCGSSAVLSEEVARKQPFWADMRDGENVVLVKDPRDIDSLAAAIEGVLRNPERAIEMGLRGRSLVQSISADDLGAFYEGVFARAIDPGDTTGEGHVGGTAVRGVVDDDEFVRELRGFLARHMPASVRLFSGWIEEWVQQHSPGVDGDTPGVPELAHVLAEYLVDRLEADGGELAGREGVVEVVRFERDKLWLAVDLESRQGKPPFLRTDVRDRQRDGSQELLTLVPLRSNWVRISEYTCDVEGLSRLFADDDSAIDALTSPSPADNGHRIMLFHKRGNLSGRIFRINSALRRLLELADGTRTVDQIGRKLRESSIPDGDVERQLRQLAREEIVALV